MQISKNSLLAVALVELWLAAAVVEWWLAVAVVDWWLATAVFVWWLVLTSNHLVSHLGDNCPKNSHLYFATIKLMNYLPKPPHSNVLFLIFPLKFLYFAPKSRAATAWIQTSANEKCCYIMAVGFWHFIAEYTVTNFWCYPIRHCVIFASALEYCVPARSNLTDCMTENHILLGLAPVAQ